MAAARMHSVEPAAIGGSLLRLALAGGCRVVLLPWLRPIIAPVAVWRSYDVDRMFDDCIEQVAE